METRHAIHIESSNTMDALPDHSVDLVVTSPPYPMISMWDETFVTADPKIGEALKSHDGDRAFERMHRELAKTWKEVHRVLRDGGFVCINVGDATRKIGNNFQIYMNSAKIVNGMKALGFDVLPPIIWKKTTNSPTKFMGSGMLPAGAYVTLENEYILIFRKGGKRAFKSAEDRFLRRQSAFFWEERNAWFTNLWTLSGRRQKTSNGEKRARNGAFGLDIPLRLIAMYSIQGDVVLDPFTGTGTTNIAAAILARHSVGYEIEGTILNNYKATMARLKPLNEKVNSDRLNHHLDFLKTYKNAPKYYNENLNTKVVTSQETDMYFYTVDTVLDTGAFRYKVTYR